MGSEQATKRVKRRLPAHGSVNHLSTYAFHSAFADAAVVHLSRPLSYEPVAT